MKLFFRYLLQIKWRLCAYIAFLAVFCGAFALYRLPFEAIIYPALLCSFIGTVLILLEFFHTRRCHKVLEKLKEYTEIPPAENLPVPEHITDEDYQALIRLLCDEEKRLRTESAVRYQDMTDYYTVWAHQIKTPIASMRLTLEGEDTPAARKLNADLSRIERYVEMVMAFIRLDSDSRDFLIRSYSADELIRGAVRKFAADFIGRHIRLEYTPADGEIVTDEKWFSFVLEQVISNALKYTGEGGSISIRREGDVLLITDTGIGIAKEDLPRIFQKGFTGYNGRSDKKASGLGLYLCKRVCDQLGHRISADSVPDEGTTIRIALSQYKIKND